MWSRTTRNTFFSVRWYLRSSSSGILLLGQGWTITSSQIYRVRANLRWREELQKGDIYCRWQDFNMLQVPTGSNMPDLNAKPLQGQRTRYLMNLTGYWHSEDQTRAGEYERRVFEEQKALRCLREWSHCSACSQWLQKHSWKETTFNVGWMQWRNTMKNGHPVLSWSLRSTFLVLQQWFLWSSGSTNTLRPDMQLCSYYLLHVRVLWDERLEIWQANWWCWSESWNLERKKNFKTS